MNKLIKGIAILSIIGMAVVPSFSHAQTSDPASIAALQARLAELLKQVADLQKQIAAAQGNSCYDFRVNLAFGSRGDDVAKLHTILKKTGAIIPDEEVNERSFGEGTASAVVGFQVTYRNEILKPLGLSNPTGVVGPATRSILNRFCGEEKPIPNTPTPTPKPGEPGQGEQPIPAKSGILRVLILSMEKFSSKGEKNILTSPSFTVSLYRGPSCGSVQQSSKELSEECTRYREDNFVATQNTVNGITEFRDLSSGAYFLKAEASGYEMMRSGGSVSFTSANPISEMGFGAREVGRDY